MSRPAGRSPNTGTATEARDRDRRMRLGLWVFAWLVALEFVEYAVGVTLEHNLIPLMVLTIPGSWPLLRYNMRIDRLRRERED